MNMTSQPSANMRWNRDTDDVFLIILDEAGPSWSAQTGGFLCNHRSANGWRVPLKKSLGLECDCFHDRVCGLAYRSETDESERSRAADVIDGVFSNSLYAFKVDRGRLNELEEAWIPIIAGKDVQAILTYGNCD